VLSILLALTISNLVSAEESARCIEESSEETFADASARCALPKSEIEADIAAVATVSPLNEDTPVAHTKIEGDKNLTDSRPWRAPKYSSQAKSLGYSSNAFAVPKGMEKQVQFWMDIYTKYSTDQGVVHDSENVDLVYEVVDFKDIVSNGGLTVGAKEKLKQKRVDEIKKKYIATLAKLENIKSEHELNDEKEKRIWKYMSALDEPNKFQEAMQKNRMRFQLGQSDRMQAAIFFSGRYLEDMEKIFRDAGMPIELTRLAFVESSFNVLARSKVGASGLWQIMPYTARPYRYISAAVDNRNSPLEATKLATRLLRDNYRMLDSWPLAVTGWNHGPTGVRKMTESYKTRNIVDLVENVRSRKSFGFASRNFYASFLAALEVEKNANKYFSKPSWSQPLKAQSLKVPTAIRYKELLTWFGNDDEKAQVFNPHLTKQVRKQSRPIPAHTLVFVPTEKYSSVLVSLARKDSRGDTLYGIAKECGVRVKDILSHNDMDIASKILPGQVLKIPH
jgi:membrane-bound lytic murein transglycosylase D